MIFLKWLTLFCNMLLLGIGPLYAQKIKIDDSLRLNSEQWELKTKGGFSSIIKFRFGDYSIVSGKAGWQKTRHESKLFNVNEVSESKEKYSFVFTSAKGDTSHVNVVTNSIIEIVDYNKIPFASVGKANMAMIVGSRSNYFASFQNNSDTTIWTLVMVQKGGQAIDPSQAFAFEGGLTDGTIKYDLRPVNEWETGKAPGMSFGLPGYELLMEGRAVAAVQAPLNTLYKKYVWIDKSLDTSTRFLLATAIAAIAENVFSQLNR